MVWDPSLLAYDFGPMHPMAPIRLRLKLEASAFLLGNVSWLLLLAFALASCSSTKYGCPGANYSGERFKASKKFKWE